MNRILIGLIVFGLAGALFWLPKSCHNSPDAMNAQRGQGPSSADKFDSKSENGETNSQGGDMSEAVTSTQGREPQATQDPLEFLRTNHPGDWHAMFDQRGRVSTLLGGVVEELGKDESSLLRFSKQMAPFFQVPVEQLSEVQEVSESGLAEHYFAQQSVGLFDVYGAGLQFAVRKDNRAIFQINSTLKPINGFDRNMQYNQSSAWQIVRGHFSEFVVARIDKNVNPVLFADNGPDNVELAWVFLVRLNGKGIDEREIVIGAQSGDVLADIKRLVH